MSSRGRPRTCGDLITELIVLKRLETPRPSYSDIAAWLNVRGVPPPAAEVWEKSHVWTQVNKVSVGMTLMRRWASRPADERRCRLTGVLHELTNRRGEHLLAPWEPGHSDSAPRRAQKGRALDASGGELGAGQRDDQEESLVSPIGGGERRACPGSGER